MEWGGDPCGRPAGGRSSHPVGLEGTLAVALMRGSASLTISSLTQLGSRGPLRSPWGRRAGAWRRRAFGFVQQGSALAVAFGERGLCLRLSSAIPCQRGKLRLLALSLGEGERHHHRVFSTRKVKISSPHQWDILANLIAPVHGAKHIDIQ